MPDDALDRFLRSCRLAKASWDVLRADSELLVLPILSILATVAAMFVFVISMRAAGITLPNKQDDMLQAMQANPALFAWFFIAYLLVIFIGLFFNTALVGAALDRLEGGNPTVASALALAGQRMGPIFCYAMVSATVGFLMGMVVERIGGLVGRLVGRGIGFAWTVVTFFVVPILAAEGGDPITAIGESTALLRKTWGESLIGNVGISLAMSAIAAITLIFGLLSGFAASQQGYPELIAPIFMSTVFLLLVSGLLGLALRGIYVAAVYHYAVTGKPPWRFTRDTLEAAFRNERWVNR
jgi:hypothetical protein